VLSIALGNGEVLSANGEIVRVMLNVRDAELPAESVTVSATVTVVVGALVVATSAVKEEVVVIACCPCTVPEIVAVVVSALTVSIRPRGKVFAFQVNGALPPDAAIWQL
jgi:hypothetical protein